MNNIKIYNYLTLKVETDILFTENMVNSFLARMIEQNIYGGKN